MFNQFWEGPAFARGVETQRIGRPARMTISDFQTCQRLQLAKPVNATYLDFFMLEKVENGPHQVKLLCKWQNCLFGTSEVHALTALTGDMVQ